MPWMGPLLVGLVRVVIHRTDPGARTALYASAGLVSGVVFFSLAKSRVPSYVLPLAPAAALIVIWQLGQELEDRERRGAGSLALIVTMGLFAATLGAAGLRLDEPEFVRLAWIGSGIYATGLLAAGAGLFRKNPRLVYGSAAVTSFTFLLLLMAALLPKLGQTHSTAALVDAVPALRGGRSVFVVDMKVPSLTYYLDAIPESIDMANLEDRVSVAPQGFLVFDEDDFPNAPASVKQRLIPIGNQGKYQVFELSPNNLRP
jgi:4-amino-4-deoxy-L-arabinose transferase-like glycosyltransferase